MIETIFNNWIEVVGIGVIGLPFTLMIMHTIYRAIIDHLT